MKLSTRVSELIDEGYPISKEWVTVQNRFGEDVRVMKYLKDNICIDRCSQEDVRSLPNGGAKCRRCGTEYPF